MGLVHVDHAADPGSAGRAARAAELAGELALQFRLERVDVPAGRRRGEGPEAAARRLRYAALEAARRATGATRVLTAHHRDDQVETLLLQLLRGAPVEALVGIAERRGALVRPLLALPRAALAARLEALGLEPIADPTNLDLRRPRNRARHLLLPRLRRLDPGIDDALLALGERSRGLRSRLDRLFEARGQASSGGLDAPRSAREIDGRWIPELPQALRLPALRWILHARLGADRLPSLPSMNSFLSALEREGGAELLLPKPGFPLRRLATRRGALRVEDRESRIPAFSYTFSIPGEVELPELGLRLRVGRSRVEPWMFRGDPRRAGLVAAPGRATVRNRRPGDRLHPIGAPGTRKLKAILIDRRVPEESRDRIPLLELAGRLAWVPGVTLDRRFAIAGEVECWLAELEPLPATESGPARTSERMAH